MKDIKRWIFVVVSALFFLTMGACGLFVETIPEGKIPSPTPNDHFVKIGDVRFHYVEYPGGGENVFLLHGFASSTYTWEKVAPALNNQGYHVWALDMKGFGWSDKPKGGDYNPVTLMEEVNKWMDLMGLEHVVFVGNSLGGSIAVLMALEHPEKVGRMVLVDAAAYPGSKPLMIRMAHLPLSTTFLKLTFGRWMIKWNMRQVFFHKEWITKKQIDAYYDRLCTKNALDAQASLARTLDFDVFADVVKRIPELNVKTLILWGQEDKWIPLENGYRFRKEISNSTLVVIPECGHIPQEEHPEVVSKVLLDFIGGRPIEDTPGPLNL